MHQKAPSSKFNAPLYPPLPPMFLRKFDRVNNVFIAYLVRILLKNYVLIFVNSYPNGFTNFLSLCLLPGFHLASPYQWGGGDFEGEGALKFGRGRGHFL